MASMTNAMFCVVAAIAVWGCIGFSLAMRFAPRSIAFFLSPLMGWAVHSVVVLPLFFGLGLSRGSVIAVVASSLLLAASAIFAGRRAFAEQSPSQLSCPLLVLAVVLAAAISVVVMSGVLPKISSAGVALPHPIFDHSKVAMIAEMMRSGVPPENPFIGDTGDHPRLAYYYLWHFSAAELALLTGAAAWNADAGLVGFTSFASLMMMMGLAIHLSQRASSAVWVVVLTATATVRTVLSWIFGFGNVAIVAGWPTGFAGWLFQIVWAPQHVAAGGCAVLAVFGLVGLAKRPGIIGAIVFGLLAAAAFESSTWVGGVTLPLAVAAIGVMMFVTINPLLRWRFVTCIVAGAILALLFASPLIYDQIRAGAARGMGSPIAIAPFQVFDDPPVSFAGKVLDVLAYWIVLLPIEWPVILLAGVVSFVAAFRERIFAGSHTMLLRALAVATLISLAVGWLLLSTIAQNNDLAWRGVLPAIVILIVISAAGLPWLMARASKPLEIAFAILLAASLYEGTRLFSENLFASPTESSQAFAQSPRMWAAVRRYAGPADRVANNPLMMRDMTPWPVNISWALLSDRRSCYAGNDLALPFAPMTAERRQEVNVLFERVFAGGAQPGDVAQLAMRFHCRVILLTPQDGAWSKDPFASSPDYRLVDDNPGNWRIYTAAAGGR